MKMYLQRNVFKKKVFYFESASYEKRFLFSTCEGAICWILRSSRSECSANDGDGKDERRMKQINDSSGAVKGPLKTNGAGAVAGNAAFKRG